MKTSTGVKGSMYQETSPAAAAEGAKAGLSAQSNWRPSIASSRQTQECLADGYACSAMEERYGIREEGMF